MDLGIFPSQRKLTRENRVPRCFARIFHAIRHEAAEDQPWRTLPGKGGLATFKIQRVG
jgi:hypothetical protein